MLLGKVLEASFGLGIALPLSYARYGSRTWAKVEADNTGANFQVKPV